MHVEQARWTASEGWGSARPGGLGESAQLVLLFGSTAVMKDDERLAELRRAYPAAQVLGCSTAGEIFGTQVTDDSLVMTAIRFERTALRLARVRIGDVSSSFEAGERLAQALDPDGLVHVFVLSDGLKVNGAELVSGLTLRLPTHVTVTGGLSGDGTRFQETLVLCDEAIEPDTVAALGMYGESLKVGCASLGGWDPFGPERRVTRSKANVLYELDGEPALKTYKRVLGSQARGLPASGLLFPLSLETEPGMPGVVRTILDVNEDDQSITFAGDLPEQSRVRMLRANFDRLIDSAADVAQTSYQAIGGSTPDLAVLISCVGRKAILQDRIAEEVVGVRGVMGDETVLTGFYSYGEISPFTPNAKCELHNQTMAITTFSER
jgi:hypothetical protein